MTTDKGKGVSTLIASMVRKSKIVRASSLRETSDSLPEIVSKDVHFLDDEEAIAVRRIATYKYLDFPHLQRAGAVEGVISFGSSLGESVVGDFLSSMPDEGIFVFLEPWLLRGAILTNTTLLVNSFWEFLDSCDCAVKIYDLSLERSCILSLDGDEPQLRFTITK